MYRYAVYFNWSPNQVRRCRSVAGSTVTAGLVFAAAEVFLRLVDPRMCLHYHHVASSRRRMQLTWFIATSTGCHNYTHAGKFVITYSYLHVSHVNDWINRRPCLCYFICRVHRFQCEFILFVPQFKCEDEFYTELSAYSLVIKSNYETASSLSVDVPLRAAFTFPGCDVCTLGARTWPYG